MTYPEPGPVLVPRTLFIAAAVLSVLGAAGLGGFALAYAHFAGPLLQRLDFNTGEVLMKKALTMEEAGDNEHAKELYLLALESRFQGDQNRAYTQRRLGAIYLQEKNPDAALPLLREAVKSPGGRGAYAMLCNTLVNLRYYEEAQKTAEQWMATPGVEDAQRAEALFYLGRIAQNLDKDDEAMARFLESDALDPGGAAASELAPLYYKQGHYAEALKHADNVLRHGISKGRAEHMRQLRVLILRKQGKAP